jgi:MFS transporter, UMF1 family
MAGPIETSDSNRSLNDAALAVFARRPILGWVLFDWAAQPFYTLLTTFIYAPYFVSAVASDPVRGQAIWGYATAAAGFVIAFSSPVLGAIADASGRRKPWIAAFGVVFVIATAMLWFGKPKDETTVLTVLVAMAFATLAVEFATVFNNAMMPSLVPAHQLGRLSGFGWATGYIGGIFSLVLMLGFLVADAKSGKTLLGLSPWFGLDPAMREGDRAAGPVTALWFIVFVIPLFLFTPDQPSRLALAPAVRSGLTTLGDSLRKLRHHRDAALFLLANMIYADGLVALFIFGGILAASTFGWTTIEIGVFGVLLAISGTFGAVLGGLLDDRLGPKPVIMASLTALLFALSAMLAIYPDYIGPFQVAPPTKDDGLFASAAEQAYLAAGLVVGFAAGPLQASSRSFLVRIAPRERITQFFGLFALTGRITSFLGPLSVAAVTQWSGNQRGGISILTLFFAAGMVVLSQVRAVDPDRPPPANL